MLKAAPGHRWPSAGDVSARRMMRAGPAALLVLLFAQAPAFASARYMGGLAEPMIVDCPKVQWPRVPGCKYRCPDNSCVSPRSKCVDSFNDCVCDQWYKKTLWETCEVDLGHQCFRRHPGLPDKGCDYECPPNSCVKEGVRCVEGPHHCMCELGYKMDQFTNDCVPMSLRESIGRNACMRSNFPPKEGCDYVCPEYSCVRPGTKCVNSIRDCICFDKYIMNEVSQCMPTAAEYDTYGRGGS